MKVKNFAVSALAAAVVGLMSPIGVAEAAVINTMFNAGLNEIQDQDAERVLRPTDSADADYVYNGQGFNVVTSGGFQVGDVIETVFRFDTVNAVTIADELPSPYQLLGHSLLEIGSISLTTDQNGNSLIDSDDIVSFVFNTTGLMGANVAVELYERTTNATLGYNAGAVPETGVAEILNETLILELGLLEADDFWFGGSVFDISLLAAATQGSGQAASGIFGLSVITNPGNLPILKNGILSSISGQMHDVVGDASAYAREVGVNSGWLVSSNTNASFNVPEPGTLALTGLGLLFAGAARRRMSIAA